MGLFDNLFLDQNTPITINDGIDHSKDILSSGYSRASTKEKGGDQEKNPSKKKKEDTFQDLFDSHTKKEKTQAESPKKDIALEIGLPPVEDHNSRDNPQTSSDTLPDIGGDIAFDIGGVDFSSDSRTSINGENNLSSTESHSSTADSTNFISLGPIPPTLEEIASVSSAENTTSDISIDSTLFSLLNENTLSNNQGEKSSQDTPVENPANPDSMTSTISSDSSHDPSSSIDSTNFLRDITENSTSSESSPLPSTISGDSRSISISPSSEKKGYHTIFDNRLRGKLGDFITELQLLDKDNDIEREKRERQIQALEERITALREEQSALRREIEQMDNERNHIKTLITTFRDQIEKR